MKPITHFLIITVLFCYCSYCFGDFSGLQFKKYNKNNSSLPSNKILHIAEDSLGFIWIATNSGLWRFDGIEFESLESITGNPQSSLLNIEIEELFFDSNNHLWIGTFRNGVYLLNTQDNQLQHFKPDNNLLTKGALRHIVEDNNSNIWIATREGINKFNLKTNKMTLFNKQDLSISNNGIYAFEFSPKDNLLWIGTDQGISQFSATTLSSTNINKEFFNPLNDKRITNIHFDGENKVWLGTKKNLWVYNYQNQALSPALSTKSRVLNYVQSISSDNQNRLWVSTNNELLVFNQQNMNLKWSRPVTNSLNKENRIYHIHISAKKQLWLATEFTGLWKANLSNLVFDIYSATSSVNKTTIKNNRICSIYEDGSNNTWISTLSTGIDHFNKSNNQWTHFPVSYFSKHHKKGKIRSITGNNKDILWLNIDNNIIQYHTKTATKTFLNFEKYQLVKNHTPLIHKLLYDKKQRLWVLSKPHNLSVIQLNQDSSIFFNTQSLRGNYINNIIEGKNGNIWLATNHGLLKYQNDNKTFEKYGLEIGKITNPAINAIEENPTGTLWLGTDYGLIKYSIDSKETELYTVKDGLSNNVIYDILTDNDNNLWISTFNGLNQFNHSTQQFDIFYKEDGLPDNEFDANTSLKSSNGYMYFAGPNGIVYFDPSKIKRNLKQPDIVLTEFKIIDQKITYTPDNKYSPLQTHIQFLNNITLNHTQNDFSFKFAALDYHNSKLNQYQYKLQGYDDNWRTTDYRNRIARYSNLAAGVYTLSIKASNNHKTWNEEGKKVNITILPPPWKTWWAYTIYSILIILLIYGIYYLRTIQLRQRAAELQKKVDKTTADLKERNHTIEELLEKKDDFFANISHELRTPLTLILGPTNKLYEHYKDSTAVSNLDLIKANSQRLSILIDQILQLSTMYAIGEKDKQFQSISQLSNVLAASFQAIAENKDITFKVSVEKDIWILAVPMAMESLVSNLLSNAFKYTPNGGSIGLSITKSENTVFQLIVEDTGIGISDNDKKKVYERFTRVNTQSLGDIEGVGLGLALVKRIIELHNGTIDIESRQNQGSKFIVTLPLSHSDDVISNDMEGFNTNLQKETIKQLDYLKQYYNKPEKASVKNSSALSTNPSTLPHVLIIDDTPDMLQLLEDLLSDYYQCTTASTGKEGISYAEKEIPDLILCDIMMDEMDGYQVLSHLRNKLETSHIPILMISALSDRASRLKSFDLLATDHINKPFDNDELLAQMASILLFRQLRQNKIHQMMDIESTELDIPDIVMEGKDREFLIKLKEVVRDNYHKSDFTLDEFAEKFYFSKRKLQYKTNALLGISPTAILHEYRLKKAREILFKKGGTTTNLADAVGFSRQDYFVKSFKEYYGLPPKTYRKKVLENIGMDLTE